MAKYEHEKTRVVIENATRVVVIREKYRVFRYFFEAVVRIATIFAENSRSLIPFCRVMYRQGRMAII